MENDQEPEKKKSSKKKSENVTIKKSTLNKLIMGIIATAIVSAFLGGYVVGSETVEPEKIIIQDVDTVLKGQTTQPSTISVSLDDDPVLGDPNAPITMIEFSDYQCPFCLKFYSTTLKQIEANYIETGKVKFVYRDFPIPSLHANAIPAALASECANEQDVFWQYHDLLFNNQKNCQNLDSSTVKNAFTQ